MRVEVACIAGSALLASLSFAQGQGHLHDHAVQAAEQQEPPIRVLINPEARVSVSRSAQLPPPAACGSAVNLPVRIINKGFVTAPLEAQLTDSGALGVLVHFDPKPLTGRVEEWRILRIALMGAGLVDVTISFRTPHGIPDSSGGDRIHLLLRCG